MSVAPLPLFGERHLLHATQGIAVFHQATKNERLDIQNWFGKEQ